ncbi:MAG: LysR substrate-binding domain-containing protein [Ralstonia sp.]|uniref:LysR family transcriptional regulator n=1 Tax=Ralstonia pickettii TaxID=329 RepID=A0A9Q2C7G0_RALPI|nr:LysR substrate-binding domain-containing protein [Ralstonia pickettii]MBA9845008.1 LysR family transcriptional regulator [Ralstonia pickettii]MBA9850522.1 LysR family transcriptional regulator [Ralstonia pickettii]MBA9877391.1 LysR family transcriptional regulator [Ralstonia pickettii]MBA9881643.1 LysR family transcriptional regulator [Ralstonia pickettii]MBA9887140.1 LysR family transcriptional regulator [Ralstonia pickettii]
MSTPLVRLASLDLLRGFVAVGRRMSITLAADDLCLTQSAVSRQVSALEEALGVKLLVRGHRSIAFTPEGERLFRSADSAVQQLQDAIGAIRVAAERRPVTITASIGVTGLWLLPRLARFQLQYPDIDVRVATNNRLVDLKNEGIELAIRYCPPGDAPPGAIRLFGETVAPVAHPSLGLRSLDSAEALAGLTLLDFDDRDLRRPWLQWTDWLAAAGWSHAKPRTVLRFNQHDQIIHAAVAGQGIALGRLELIAPLLADGRLVTVPTIAPGVRKTHAYWLIQSEPNPRRDVRDVAAWICSEAATQATHASGASELA